MSRAAALNLFPATVEAIENIYPGVLNTLFPIEVEALCPTPSVSVRIPLWGVTLKVLWPWLVPIALLGAIIGFVCGGTILVSGLNSPPGTFSRGLGMCWFGSMNLVALACHSFVPKTTELWDEVYVSDWAFTCCAAICGGLALLADSGLFDDRSTEAHGIVLGLNVIIILAATQLRTADTWWSQLAFEQLYLGGVALGVVAGSIRIVHLLWLRSPHINWIGFGAIVVLSSQVLIFFDAWLCVNLGSLYGHFGLLPTFFLLFNIVHLALFFYHGSLHATKVHLEIEEQKKEKEVEKKDK